MGDTKVYIFYSSDTEPELLDMYSGGIQYLKDGDVELEVVDVSEDQETAREHDVTATPLLIVEREDGENERHHGMVGGLKQLLMEDLYGLSVLQKMGFREGREMVREMENVSQESIESYIEDALKASGVESVEVEKYDTGINTASVTLHFGDEIDLEEDELEHDVRPFLGGVFTEAFGKGVSAELKKASGNTYIFRVAAPDAGAGEGFKDMLGKLLGS